MTRIPPALVVFVVLAGCGGPAGRITFRDEERRRDRRDAGPSTAELLLDLHLRRRRGRGRGVAVEGRDVRRLLPPTFIKGPKAGRPVFAVLPVGQDWRRLAWRHGHLVNPRDEASDVRTEDGQVYRNVPGAMILPIAPPPRKSLGVGTAVRVHAGRGLVYGRVRAVRDGEIEVDYGWLGQERSLIARPEEVLVVRGVLQRAGPVIFPLGPFKRLGALVISHGRFRWVVGPEGVVHRVGWTAVEPVAMDRKWAVGDKAWGAMPLNLRPVRIAEVIAPGLLFRVERERRAGWRLRRRSMGAVDDQTRQRLRKLRRKLRGGRPGMRGGAGAGGGAGRRGARGPWSQRVVSFGALAPRE